MMMISSSAGRCSVRLGGRAILSAGTRRMQSTSTMGAVAAGQGQQQITSTLQYNEKKDFSTAVAADPNNERAYGAAYHEEQLQFLLSAFRALNPAAKNVEGWRRISARAVEMDLMEAAVAARGGASCDKVLIMIRPGESMYSVYEHGWVAEGNNPNSAAQSEEYPRDGLMTGKGCGQVLDLARRTAIFCNDDTGLVPELFVVSPLRRAVQSALLTFPSLAPGSVRDVPWVCHGGLMERAGLKADFVSSAEELEDFFPGVDYSFYRDTIDPVVVNSMEGRNIVESKKELLERTDEFLEWIKERDERVIVVASHSTWFQSFCGFTLQYEPEGNPSRMFGEGEMRCAAIKFD